MTTAEYIASLFLAIAVALIFSFWKNKRLDRPLRVGVGVLVGFSAFVIALMITGTIGNIYLNAAAASLFLSIVAGNSWRRL